MNETQNSTVLNVDNIVRICVRRELLIGVIVIIMKTIVYTRELLLEVDAVISFYVGLIKLMIFCCVCLNDFKVV